MSELVLFIDTETTGMYWDALPWDHPTQPRMVQVAAILAEPNGESIAELSTIIKPCGQWKVSDGAARIHGFTTEVCEDRGLAIRPVLDVLVGMWERAGLVAAHNAGFDSKIVKGEFARVLGVGAVPDKSWNCTMLESAPVVGIPSLRHPGEFKWPKLAEAYKHFTKSELIDAHGALADVRACKEIFFAMRKVAV